MQDYTTRTPERQSKKQPRQDIQKRMLCRGCFGQHRTIASARFGGSFPPILRFETFEIRKVFLHVSNLDLTKNLSPNLLAELCGVA